jgi:hypothetical protein
MLRFVEGNAGFVVDDSQPPIYIASWFGEVPASIVKQFFDWQAGIYAAAKAAKKAVAIVVDVTYASRPGPKARAEMVELVDAADHEMYQSGFITNYVCIGNPLVRGAMTAMQWLSRKPWPMNMVSSVQDGIEKSIVFLRQRGVTVSFESNKRADLKF